MSGTSIIAQIFVPLSGFSIFLIFVTICSGNYQNKEKPLKHQRKFGLGPSKTFLSTT